MKFNKQIENVLLEETIDLVLKDMQGYSADSEEYKKLLNSLERLYALKEQKPKRVSNDTIATIAGNLLGIGLILSYERMHVITTKAIGFVIKGRV